MPAPRRHWDTDDDTRLRDLQGAGRTLRDVAQEMGYDPATISRHAATLGLTWDRTQTRAATAANVADAASRRSALELSLLKDAERLRRQMFAPTVAFNFGGRDNTYAEHRLTQPVYADQLRLMQAVGVAVAHSLKIAVHDGDPGTDAAVGMLDQIAAGLKAAWGQAGRIGETEAAPRSANS